MTVVVETGAGTRGANAYCSVSFVTAYLTERGREAENSWSTQSAEVQGEKVVEATSYIDRRFGRRFKGTRLQERLPGRVADGVLTLTAAPLDTETVTIGQLVYRFVATLAQENDVLIDGVEGSLDNLAAAVNGTGTSTTVEEDTLASTEARAERSGTTLEIAALLPGDNGNLVAFATTVTGASATGAGFLTGGLDEGPQPLEFPRDWLYSRDGRLIRGVPLKVRQATAEYAVRGLGTGANALAVDPTVDASLALLSSKRFRADDVEKAVTFASGGQPLLFRPYPIADRLLEEYLLPGGGTFR